MSKERLVELLLDKESYPEDFRAQARGHCEKVADYLLASSEVIVLPCKVGDTVYEIVHGVVGETEAVGFIVCQDGTILMLTKHLFPLSREIGETVFLTREEAEAKLKESEKN